MKSPLAAAVFDLQEGLRRWELWGTTGWYDIRHRYRRSVLGPFWITLSTAVMIGAIAFLFSSLLQQDIRDYLPYLSLGLIFWNLMSQIALEACTVFIAAESIIRQIQAPLSVHIYRMIYRNLIILAHNLVIYVVIAVALEIRPGWAALLFIPGLILICINGVWVGFLLGVVCTRFRDIPPIVFSVVQVLFLVTPIIWKPAQLENAPYFATLNPLYYILAVVRDPLLGQAPPLSVWILVFAMTVAGSVFTMAVFTRLRSRVAYWV